MGSTRCSAIAVSDCRVANVSELRSPGRFCASRRFLVLDEATSSLDDETEAAVLDTIAGLVPAMTVLVIAHRRTTLDMAQHVVRIEAGRRAGLGVRTVEDRLRS